MIKKLLSKLLVTAVVVSAVGISDVEARSYNAKTADFPIYMNGSLKNPEFYKLVVDGRTYLSIRDIATILGIEIDWNSSERAVYISDTPSEKTNYNSSPKYYGNKTIKSTEVFIPIYTNGIRKYPSNLELIVEGRLYLSIRDIVYMLDIDIDWDNNSKSIYIAGNSNTTVDNKGVNVEKNDMIKKQQNTTQENEEIKKEQELEKLQQQNTAEEMLRLVNEFRTENGKSKLELIPEREIQDYTKLRAEEISKLFSHTRPDGSSVSDYPALSALYYVGENISGGRMTVYDAIEGWKKSPGHRSNMLDDRYTHMYYGYYYSPNSKYGSYHVQIFGISKNKEGKQATGSNPIKVGEDEEAIKKQEELEKQRQQNAAEEERIKKEKESEELKQQNTAEEMLRLVNEFREENGKARLELIPEREIQDYTNLRAEEISRVFSHTRPDGSSALSYSGLRGFYAVGENIYAGSKTVYDAMEGWKNSSGHRNNMLNDNYTHMYYGYYHNDNSEYGDYHVQLFGTSSNN